MIEISVIAVLALAVAALSFRLLKLRNGGTAALLRDMPEMGEGRWRHGVVRYRESQAEFYRLSSVRLWPDRQLSRRDLEIIDRRIPRGDEYDIMTAEIVVLQLRDGARDYEMALDRGALTAFMSWVESRPHLGRSAAAADFLYPARRLGGLCRPTRLPQRVFSVVGDPRQDEQQVRQPVQILGGQHVGAVGVGLDGGPR